MKPFKGVVSLLLPGMLAGCMVGNPLSLFSGHLTIISATSGDPINGAIAAEATTTRDKKNKKIFFTNLNINLKRAPPFIFVFPDGHQVNSKEITSEILKAHLGEAKECYVLTSKTMPEYKKVTCYGINKGRPFNIAEFPVGTRPVSYEISFSDPANEEDITLVIRTCNYRFTKTLGSADGSQFFDMPIDQDGLDKLFNIQTKVVFEDVILDRFHPCDPE